MSADRRPDGRTSRVRDVRARMPGYEACRGLRRQGPVTGIAIHHSATAHPVTGLSRDDAASVFRYHVETLGWSRGGYHYLVHPGGLVEYALDEGVPALHAGFTDPDDGLQLERGQYWNNHLLAVCLLGWFERDRRPRGAPRAIPNRFTAPTRGQWNAVVELVTDLVRRYSLGPDDIRGHRDLTGCRTRCPGENVDLDALRAEVRARAAGS